MIGKAFASMMTAPPPTVHRPPASEAAGASFPFGVTDLAKNLQFASTLENPIARYRPAAVAPA